MKIVCFILLVTFCVYGKSEDPKKPDPPPAAPVAAPAATPVANPAGAPAAASPAGASGAPAGASPVPGMSAVPGLSALAAKLKPGATGSGIDTGMVGAVEVVKHGFDVMVETGRKWADVGFGGLNF